MRREKRRNDRIGTDFKKVLYISGSILSIAIIGFVITFFVYGNKMKNRTELSKLNTSIVDNYTENTQAASSVFGKTVNEAEETTLENTNNQIENNTIENTDTTKYAVNTSEVEKSKTSQNEVQKTMTNTTKTDTVTPKQEEKKEEKVIKDPEFKMPVSGEIVKEFAKDKLVYSNTLSEWITHNGVDIKAEKTTVVKSSAEGTIKAIKNDPRYGLTVVIEHVNGFTSIYSNLLTAEFVVEGEKVKEGQTIGTVGSTATFEIADEPHLHFEISKDGEYLDPELYIKK